jgi:hypothetical protein
MDCIETAKSQLVGAMLEARMDSAFLNQDIIFMLSGNQIKVTTSVPFNRSEKPEQLVLKEKH